MNTDEVTKAFKEDSRFDGDKMWRRVFVNLEPDEAYDVLKAIFGEDEVSKFPKSLKPKFKTSLFEKFTDALAEKVAEFEDVDKASEDLEFDIDLDVLERFEPSIEEMASNGFVDHADAKVVLDVAELADAMDENDEWRKILPLEFKDYIEELAKFVKDWEVE